MSEKIELGVEFRLNRNGTATQTRMQTQPQSHGCPVESGSPRADLKLLSVIIPARDEAGCIAVTVRHIHEELRSQNIPHEIVVVDDGSLDDTWKILGELRPQIPQLVPVQNAGPHGFGRAVTCGLNRSRGDAVVIVMADESDDCRDVTRYSRRLNEGWDCVFGSRFLKGGGTTGYPALKYALNRLVNRLIRIAFHIPLNDTTNAFKAYRRKAIDGCRPLLAPHFNLTVELPLKAIVRGYSWTVIPVTWRNRRTGAAKFAIKEMGSRYFFIICYVWLEKYFSAATIGGNDPAGSRSNNGRPSPGALLSESRAAASRRGCCRHPFVWEQNEPVPVVNEREVHLVKKTSQPVQSAGATSGPAQTARSHVGRAWSGKTSWPLSSGGVITGPHVVNIPVGGSNNPPR